MICQHVEGHRTPRSGHVAGLVARRRRRLGRRTPRLDPVQQRRRQSLFVVPLITIRKISICRVYHRNMSSVGETLRYLLILFLFAGHVLRRGATLRVATKTKATFQVTANLCFFCFLSPRRREAAHCRTFLLSRYPVVYIHSVPVNLHSFPPPT